jgi:hypothetical protein
VPRTNDSRVRPRPTRLDAIGPNPDASVVPCGSPGPPINPGHRPHGKTAEGAVLQVGPHLATDSPQKLSSPLSPFSFLGRRPVPVGTNLPVCPPAARPSSASGCRASGDPRFVPAKTPQAWRPCVPHQAGQAHVTSVGGAFTHPSRGAVQSWGTPTGGVRFVRPPANVCDPYRGVRLATATSSPNDIAAAQTYVSDRWGRIQHKPFPRAVHDVHPRPAPKGQRNEPGVSEATPQELPLNAQGPRVLCQRTSCRAGARALRSIPATGRMGKRRKAPYSR